jgi:c-di-GMP-binding flagellar brake protein YcgR
MPRNFACGMPQLCRYSPTMDDRRQRQRYPIHGPVNVLTARGRYVSEIYDISLNGALLLRAVEDVLRIGEEIQIELALTGAPDVSAKARVAHIHGDRFGVEFQDMGTRDFDVFSGLVLMLEQQARPSFNV